MATALETEFPSCQFAGADVSGRRARRGHDPGESRRFCRCTEFQHEALVSPATCHACRFAGTEGTAPPIESSGDPCGKAAVREAALNTGLCQHLGEIVRLTPCSCHKAKPIAVHRCGVFVECVRSTEDRMHLTREDADLAKRKSCETCAEFLAVGLEKTEPPVA